MKKTPKRKAAKKPAVRKKPLKSKDAGQSGGSADLVASTAAAEPAQADFDVVLELIDAARTHAVAAVNTTLIELYWNIGEFIVRKIEADGWGKGTVEALAEHIRQRKPDARGFSVQNLWRMRQFFEVYRDQPNLSALLRDLSWTNNLMILGKCKRNEEREFYLRMAVEEKWPSRELERQINGALFERVVLSPPNLAPALREIHPEAAGVFKDAYLVEFLQLPSGHSEADLHAGLIEHLKQFLIELGRDFCFVGSQYLMQVGGRDFFLDLLFFNRALNCLVAFELKIEEFQPEHLGKLEFYLEALDRDVRKPHEGPSVGVLLCATKDHEVVEYALSRAVSPALVAQYHTALPDRKLLQQKLHEFYELAQSQAERNSAPKKLSRAGATAPARKKAARKGRRK
jgi:predicted nuclease of restriction endonuclease-like (RecB) superfamily